MSDTGIGSSVQHTMGSSEGLGRKLHGLPIWGWAILVVGGGLLIYYLYTKYAGGAGTVTAASANGTGLSGVPTTDTSGGTLTSGSTSGSQYASNQAYMNAAISEYGTGTNTPLSVSQALSDLFNGNPLSSSEQGIINQVYGGLGAPPQSTPAPVLASTPAATTVTGYVKSATNPTIYQVTSDNTLHPVTSWGSFTTLDPSLQYSTLDTNDLAKYQVGSSVGA